MFSFSTPELGVILVIALLVFGPGKLPEVGKSIGKGLGELRRSMNSEPTKEETIAIQAKTVAKKDSDFR